MLHGLDPPSDLIAEWYRALDEVTDEQLEAEVGEEEPFSILRKRPDAWRGGVGSVVGRAKALHHGVH